MELPLVGWVQEGLRFLAGRPRLRVRVFKDDETMEVGCLEFEVENRGGRPTSLEPTVTVDFLVLRNRRMVHERAQFAVRESSRLLPPFEARVFTASVVRRADYYSFSWFRHYRFRTGSGHTGHAYARHTLLTPLSRWRYYWELATFRVLGRLHGGVPVSIDEMEAERRSLGPH